MSRTLKSVRQSILQTLLQKGELTVDGMLDYIEGHDRAKIAANVAQLVTEKLATRRKDDATGMPAYKITDIGVGRIKSDDETVTSTTETAKPASNPTQAICHDSDVSELSKLVEAGVQQNSRLHKENQSLRANINNLIVNERELAESAEVIIAECERLKAENRALTILNESMSMPGFSAKFDEQAAVEQFLIRAPKRKPMVVKSLDKARKHAMSAAKTVGKVEVFAMVSVGHAARGAVWNQTQTSKE